MKYNDYNQIRQEFTDYLKQKQFSHKSLSNRITVFNQYLKWLEQEGKEIEQINYVELTQFMKYCQNKEISQRTIQHYMTIVKHYYDYLIREKRINVNPAEDIKVKGVKRKVAYHILEASELNHIYNHYPANTLQDRRNKVLLGMFIYQGLHTEEVGKLIVDDVKLREGKIIVAGGIRRNGRELQLESHQVMDMYDYVLQVRSQLLNASSGNLLFVGNSISNMVTKTMLRAKRINSTLLNAKQIRASVITKWLRTYNLREVQYLAGHRYISSTENYQHNDMEGLKEEVQMFHPLG